MSDTRLINRIAGFLTPEALDDVGEGWDEDADADRRKIAKRIIAIVRHSDQRRRARLGWHKVPSYKIVKQAGL